VLPKRLETALQPNEVQLARGQELLPNTDAVLRATARPRRSHYESVHAKDPDAGRVQGDFVLPRERRGQSLDRPRPKCYEISARSTGNQDNNLGAPGAEKGVSEMRLIKMLGLAAVAAVAAMALVGGSSALAEASTTICSVHDSLVCPGDHEVEEFTAKAGTTVLKTNLATVLCLTSKVTAEVECELLDNPLKVLLSELDFLECGTNSEHNNCTVTVEQLPLLTVSKTRLNVGTVTVNKELPAEINVKCGKIINCTYSEPVGGKSFAVEGALDWTDSKMCRHPRLI